MDVVQLPHVGGDGGPGTWKLKGLAGGTPNF